MRIACLTTTLVLITPLAVGSAGATQAKKPLPRVRVATLAPLKVNGSFFRSRERVRLIVVTQDEQRTRSLRASRLGSFSALFSTVYVHPCSSDLSVTAIGAQGSRASVKTRLPAECPPPP